MTMRENNTIKQALNKTEIPHLPLNFSNKVMARIDARARQREILGRVGMWVAYIMIGAGVITGVKYVLTRYFSFDFDWDFSLAMPKLDLSYSGESLSIWILVAATMFVLLFADSYIRHRIRMRKLK